MQTMRIRNAALIFAAAAAVSGCATVKTPTKGDPFEGFNRTVYQFNDKVDRYALKPVAQGYQRVLPQPVRDSVTNFFSNIGDVYVAANNLVQLRIADGVGDIMRVVINTVFGVGGLFDVATLAKLPKHTSDFGITLGHYGVPSGPYLVLPLLGPSTVRDGAGLVVDYAGNPLTYVQPASVSWGLFGLNLVNTRANLLGASNVLETAAIDKYSFLRNAYLQRRQALIRGSLNEASNLPDYGNEALPNYSAADVAAEPASGASAVSAASASAASASAASEPVASASAASGASAVTVESAANPNPASATNVPPQQFVPPSPGGLRFPSIRLH